MDLALTGPVALAERRLAWLDARQRVLAANIANADTPGFRPSDLPPFAELLARRGAPRLAATDPRHIVPASAGLTARPDRLALERTPDGNAVALDQQALRVAETDQQHALAMGLHRKYLALFRIALGQHG
ncbi:MAG: flagellar basal body protein [Rhodovarius sp.]|nr:flagellar basal body protein [Rhodovarius sp.]MCX7933058.1 flagellar basal body protein [Rhodovarius sp.]MDW8314226.1 flagellar basal body protein [Rhodovarius sp.]